MAGIIAAAKNGRGMHGVAYGSQLIAASNVVNSLAPDSELPGNPLNPWISYQLDAAALGQLVGSGASIINNSWGLPNREKRGLPEINEEYALIVKEIPDFIERARKARSDNVLYVWSSGNNSTANPNALASLPYFIEEARHNTIIVAAQEVQDSILSFSTRCGVGML